MRPTRLPLLLALAALLGLALALPVRPARADVKLSSGQTLYVPAYSHIFHGIKNKPFALTVTLSVRNVDPHQSFTLELVDYYDTEGQRVKRYLAEPVTITPLQTKEFLVNLLDWSGGSGANFLVSWSAPQPMNTPIVEAVMIGTSGNQGISFITQGREIVP